MIKTLLLNPQKIIHIFIQPINIQYYQALFLPLLFLSIFNPLVLLIGLPIFLLHSLSSAYAFHTIYFHYAATLIPIIFIAAIEPLKYLKSRIRHTTFLLIFILMFMVNMINWDNYKDEVAKRLDVFPQTKATATWNMIDQIPKQAGVIATFNLLDQVSQRKHLENMLTTARGYNIFSYQPFQLSDNIQYALLDLNNAWILSETFNNPESRSSNLNDFFRNNNWSVINAENEIVLLQRNRPDQPSLIERYDQSSFVFSNDEQILINDQFSLLNVEFPKYFNLNKNTIPMTFHWKSLVDIKKFYSIKLSLVKNQQIIQENIRSIGYYFEPTYLWEQENYIKENYWFSIADLQPGRYSLYMTIFDSKTGENLPLKQADSIARTHLIAEITLNREEAVR